MSSTSDKASGLANEAIGNLKQGLGKVVGCEKLQAEGLAQEAKGEAQKASGEAKEKVKDAANTVADKINKHL
jgi:uncharacterized protein YjbJ (UPF0337 family)